MPPLHPAFVHFPIGIFLLALVAETIGLITKRAEFSRFGWWAQLAGSFGLLAAVLTGLLAERSAAIGSAARQSFETHEELAFLTSSLFAIMLLWRIGAGGKVPANAPRLYLLLFSLATAALLITAWFGGELVFRFGTGIQLP